MLSQLITTTRTTECFRSMLVTRNWMLSVSVWLVSNFTPVCISLLPALTHTHHTTPYTHNTDATITKDIRQYLGTRFTKNSVDSELQHQIRENLHMRVVPCKCVQTYRHILWDVFRVTQTSVPINGVFRLYSNDYPESEILAGHTLRE